MESQESSRTAPKALDELLLRRIIPFMLVTVFILLDPLLYPGRALFHYAAWDLAQALLSGVLNALGAWAIFTSTKTGLKALIVYPLSTVYPLVVNLLVPFVLHEAINCSKVWEFCVL